MEIWQNYLEYNEKTDLRKTFLLDLYVFYF